MKFVLLLLISLQYGDLNCDLPTSLQQYLYGRIRVCEREKEKREREREMNPKPRSVTSPGIKKKIKTGKQNWTKEQTEAMTIYNKHKVYHLFSKIGNSELQSWKLQFIHCRSEMNQRMTCWPYLRKVNKVSSLSNRQKSPECTFNVRKDLGQKAVFLRSKENKCILRKEAAHTGLTGNL